MTLRHFVWTAFAPACALKIVDEVENAVGAVMHHVVAGTPFIDGELRVAAGSSGRSGHR